MAGLPPDGAYVTGQVPPEMREGVELGPADVAQPTHRMGLGPDGVTEQISEIRIPRPDHIPATPPIWNDDAPVPLPRPSRGTLRYEFPLFPDVQVTVAFQGNATADHLEQLTELLNVQCRKLREQEEFRRAHPPAVPRTPAPRKIRTKKEPPNGSKQTA